MIPFFIWRDPNDEELFTVKSDEAAGNPADITWSNIPQLPHSKPAKDLSGKGKKHLVISGDEAGNPADFTWSNIPQLPHLPRISVERVRSIWLCQGVRLETQLTSHVLTFLSCNMASLPRISVEKVDSIWLNQGVRLEIRLTSHGQTFLSCRKANLLNILVERVRSIWLSLKGWELKYQLPPLVPILLSSGMDCLPSEKGKRRNIWVSLKGWGVKYQLPPLVPILLSSGMDCLPRISVERVKKGTFD